MTTVSTPDTRNMDTLRKQAKRLRVMAENHQVRDIKPVEMDDVRFIAQNMERVADDYAKCARQRNEARAHLLQIVQSSLDVLGVSALDVVTTRQAAEILLKAQRIRGTAFAAAGQAAENTSEAFVGEFGPVSEASTEIIEAFLRTLAKGEE